MLQVSGLRKAHGGETLFERASFRLDRGDRKALVGPNGAGKSTLFALIMREEEPDAGEVVWAKDASLGRLPQETAPRGEETVLNVALGATEEHARLRHDLDALERSGDRSSEAYQNAVERYAEIGGFELEPKAKRILSGLAFAESDFDRPASAMSGGWMMRAHLARLLVAEPDVLLLDEPTNHLDLESLRWLQGYLQDYPGALLLVSHDRAFLNALVDGVLELRHGQLRAYRGTYDDYAEASAARDARQLAAHRAQQRRIDQLERFVERFGAKATKASQAKAKQKQIDRMEKIEPPGGAEKTIHVDFPQPERSGRRVAALKDVHFGYGGRPVYSGIDYETERGERTVLVGPNGAGKSTLLKLLGGAATPDRGERVLGHRVKAGYFSQNRMEMFDPGRTVLDEALDVGRSLPEETARTVLGAFLFRGDAVFKRVSVLSGGEKSRLGLVKLLLDPPNLLLLDEPTTHLDMASIDALINALRAYTGTLVFISHDVHFIRSIASTVARVDGGRITRYAGDYDYYLRKSESEDAREALTASHGGAGPSDGSTPAKRDDSGGRSRSGPKARRRAEAEARQARAKIRAEVQALEDEIERLEAKQKEVARRLEEPGLYENDPGEVMRLNREACSVGDELEALNERWAEAAQRLEA